MLSSAQVVAVRNAIELTYDCSCDVIEHQKYRKDDGSSGFEDVTTLEAQPCKLSFETISKNNQDDTKADLVQSVKLIISPEVEIAEGSKINVTDVAGNVKSYIKSGIPAIYKTHQEIMLDVFERWA